MFRIEIPVTFHQTFALFHLFGMWSQDGTSTRKSGRKLFLLMYYVSFVLSVIVGALKARDKDELIFLSVVAIENSVQIYRIWFMLYRKTMILSFVHEVGTHHTNDKKEYVLASDKLKFLIKFIRSFILSTFISIAFVIVVFPVVNEERLFLNIAFPLDRSKSEIALWTGFAFHTGGFFFAIVGCFITITLWYLMLNFALKYKILGSQFRHMGMFRSEDQSQPKVSTTEQQKLYVRDFIRAIQSYEKINGY